MLQINLQAATKCNKTADNWNEVQFILNVAAEVSPKYVMQVTQTLTYNTRVVNMQENVYFCPQGAFWIP